MTTLELDPVAMERNNIRLQETYSLIQANECRFEEHGQKTANISS